MRLRQRSVNRIEATGGRKVTQASAGEMQDTAEVGRRTRGRFKPGVSGNPGGGTKSKRFLALRADIVNDLGGEDALTGIDRVVVEQAVALLIRSEKAKDGNDAVRASNAASRLLASLRSTKRRRGPAAIPLREQLAMEAAEAAEREGIA
jgi:hypothetical protein